VAGADGHGEPTFVPRRSDIIRHSKPSEKIKRFLVCAKVPAARGAVGMRGFPRVCDIAGGLRQRHLSMVRTGGHQFRLTYSAGSVSSCLQWRKKDPIQNGNGR
jgi:hypothetical protein